METKQVIALVPFCPLYLPYSKQLFLILFSYKTKSFFWGENLHKYVFLPSKMYGIVQYSCNWSVPDIQRLI